MPATVPVADTVAMVVLALVQAPPPVPLADWPLAAPAQNAAMPLIVPGVAGRLTETVTVAELLQVPDVPVSVYVVVTVGLAVTLVPAVADMPVAGDQEYVVAPEPVSTVEDPGQIAVPEPALTVNPALTVTVTVAVLLQLPDVPVTV